MTIWNAVLLGLIHGIAEFLPVSSSGHFAVVNNLFKLSDLSQGHMLFQALLYLASMVSVCLVYWPEICAMYWELISFAGFGPLAGQEKERYPAARCFLMLILGTLPLFLALPINSRMVVLNGRNIFIGVMLILTGCLLYISDKMIPGKKNLSSMTVFDALVIGFCQSVATIPGLSRAAVTITAGTAVGLRRDFAVNFSFLLSIPAVFGAAILAFADALRDGIDDTNENGKKLLIIKDSYSHCFATMLAENYEEIILVDLRYYRDSVKDLLEENEITDVLFLYGAENLATSTDFGWLNY